MNRIQKISTFFLAIFKFLLVFLPAMTLLEWLLMNSEFMHGPFSQMFLLSPSFSTPEGYVKTADVVWTPLTQFVGLSADLLSLTPILISIFALICIFKHYKQGEIFNMINARYYRLIGWMFIFDAIIAKPLYQILMTFAVTFNNAPGHRYIAAGFGNTNIEALFCGGVVIIISWVMLEASKLHDEQKYTV